MHVLRNSLIALTLAVAGVAAAQTAPAGRVQQSQLPPPPPPPPPAEPMKLVSPLPPELNGEDAGGRYQPTPEEVAEIEALNAQIRENNARIAAHNAEEAARAAADRRAYERALAEREAEIARINAAAAEAQARHQAELAEWRARVAACQAGNTAACQGG